MCKAKDMINNIFKRERREMALHHSCLSLRKKASNLFFISASSKEIKCYSCRMVNACGDNFNPDSSDVKKVDCDTSTSSCSVSQILLMFLRFKSKTHFNKMNSQDRFNRQATACCNLLQHTCMIKALTELSLIQ